MPHPWKCLFASFFVLALSASFSHAQTDSPGSLFPDVKNDQKPVAPTSNPQPPVPPVPSPASSPPPIAPTQQKKIPIPNAATQKAALDLVNEAYKDDISKATTPQQQTELGKKLLQAGIETNDPAGRFVLFNKAKDTAAQSGDFDTVLAAMDDIEKVYQIDALKMELDAVKSISKTARSPEMQQKIVVAAENIVNKAIIADRYDIARSMAEIALGAARSANDADLQKDAATKVREVREAEAAYVAIKSALLVLINKPNDPTANFAVGKFRCFFKDDWDGGLPMLVLGSDPTLKALATQEIAGATEAASQVAMGDGWWKVAEKENGSAKGQIQKQAAKWYSQAVDQLTGLDKAKVETRLKSLAPVELARVINLLKLVDLKRDVIRGRWHVEEGRLSNEPANGAQIRFPYRPPMEYDFHLVYDRKAADWGIMINLCRSDKSFGCGMPDLKDNPRSVYIAGLREVIKSQAPHGAATHCDVHIQVRNGHIIIIINGEKTIDQAMSSWEFGKSPLARLGPERLGLGIIDWYGQMTVTKAEVTEISGLGKILDNGIDHGHDK